MGQFPRYLLIALIAFAAALAAIWLSRSLAIGHHPQGGELHAVMHEQLDLDPAQQVKIEALERQFVREGLLNIGEADENRLADEVPLLGGQPGRVAHGEQEEDQETDDEGDRVNFNSEHIDFLVCV